MALVEKLNIYTLPKELEGTELDSVKGSEKYRAIVNDQPLNN